MQDVWREADSAFLPLVSALALLPVSAAAGSATALHQHTLPCANRVAYAIPCAAGSASACWVSNNDPCWLVIGIGISVSTYVRGIGGHIYRPSHIKPFIQVEMRSLRPTLTVRQPASGV